MAMFSRGQSGKADDSRNDAFIYDHVRTPRGRGTGTSCPIRIRQVLLPI